MRFLLSLAAVLSAASAFPASDRPPACRELAPGLVAIPVGNSEAYVVGDAGTASSTKQYCSSISANYIAGRSGVKRLKGFSTK